MEHCISYIPSIFIDLQGVQEAMFFFTKYALSSLSFDRLQEMCTVSTYVQSTAIGWSLSGDQSAHCTLPARREGHVWTICFQKSTFFWNNLLFKLTTYVYIYQQYMF